MLKPFQKSGHVELPDRERSRWCPRRSLEDSSNGHALTTGRAFPWSRERRVEGIGSLIQCHWRHIHCQNREIKMFAQHCTKVSRRSETESFRCGSNTWKKKYSWRSHTTLFADLMHHAGWSSRTSIMHQRLTLRVLFHDGTSAGPSTSLPAVLHTWKVTGDTHTDHLRFEWRGFSRSTSFFGTDSARGSRLAIKLQSANLGVVELTFCFYDKSAKDNLVRTTPVPSQICGCQRCERVNSANETRVRVSSTWTVSAVRKKKSATVARMPTVRKDNRDACFSDKPQKFGIFENTLLPKV